jgi:hypothetical protein
MRLRECVLVDRAKLIFVIEASAYARGAIILAIALLFLLTVYASFAQELLFKVLVAVFSLSAALLIGAKQRIHVDMDAGCIHFRRRVFMVKRDKHIKLLKGSAIIRSAGKSAGSLGIQLPQQDAAYFLYSGSRSELDQWEQLLRGALADAGLDVT